MILAAGRGSRMGALTSDLPKPLICIAGKTLIERQIERLRAGGFDELVVNLAYRGEQIRHHLGDGAQFGVSIAYSQEPPGALDTGGGIAAALPLLGAHPFAVVNSDVWADFDFSHLAEPSMDAHLILVPNPAHNISGDFALRDGFVTEEGEKFTFSGIGVYRPALFPQNGPDHYPLASILMAAAAEGRVTAELFRGLWLDVGTVERLAIAKQFAALHAPPHSEI
ncbi:MAG: nucleotidyltransferase family protein [Proteobacteria bacterium]|nr:nucleotidyltransferase family protein [Pseudomonadota bacterium]